jgi:glutamate carboxypeptidase
MVHMDTVYARGKLANAPFRIEGNLAYGPGIADAKGGIAVILHALKLLQDQGFRDYGRLVVLFNTDEEKGSRGSLALIQAEAAKADYVLSFEPTLGSQESLIRATSGIAQARVQVTGRSAHAGAAPETGVNALVEASDIVLRTLDLDQGQGKLRFNWTIGSGGELANVIPETATISANIRYLNEPMLDQLVTDLEARLAKKRLPDARVVAIYAEIGHTLTVVPVTGGGTDAAYAALSGKPVIESLGLPGFGYHSNNAEYVLIDAIPRRLFLTAEMIRQLAAKPS